LTAPVEVFRLLPRQPGNFVKKLHPQVLPNLLGREFLGPSLIFIPMTNRGFRRPAPAFVFTMMAVEGKGLVSCRENVSELDGVEARDRYHRLREKD
jgi:hypothetical protein